MDPEAKTVEQFALEGDGYELIIKSGSGEIESRVVEGFAVPVRALFDDALNLEVLRETLQA